MTSRFSVNAGLYWIGGGFLFTTLPFLALIYMNAQTAFSYSLIIYLFTIFWGIVYMLFLQHKVRHFSQYICKTIDDMLQKRQQPREIYEEDHLFFKINHRLYRLYQILSTAEQKAKNERLSLQQLISDISHQIKTPLTNIKMITAMLMQQIEQPEKEFLRSMELQLDKLSFLMQSMIKVSRLENGVITLQKKVQPLYNTIAQSLGTVFIKAEQKGIKINVHCDEHIVVPHDRKWTTEAISNVLDNAIKYTPKFGQIDLVVEEWEMYAVIKITDNGIGIKEQDYPNIFKRFYRAQNVQQYEGVGLGLYLTREIITLQNGYIQVNSIEKEGTTFSIYLPIH